MNSLKIITLRKTVMAKTKTKIKVSAWSVAEIKLLKKLYAKMNNRQLARKLRRGEDSVRIKGGRLGLRKVKITGAS
jgi:ribosomal protein L21